MLIYPRCTGAAGGLDGSRGRMMKLSNHNMEQLLKASPHGIVVADAGRQDLPVTFVNAAMAALLGQPTGQLLGRPLLSLALAGSQGDQAAVMEALASGREYCLALHGVQADGQGMALRLVGLGSGGGRPGLVAGFAEPEKAAARPLTAAAGPRAGEPPLATDRITGLPSEPAMLQILQRACAGPDGASLIMLRVQCLDQYRDTFGRQAADSTLRLISRAIAGSLRRASDRVGRMDSDELLAVVERLPDSSLASLAERICQRVRELCIHHPRSSVSRYMTVAAGTTQAEAGEGTEALLRRLRQSLAQAEATSSG